LAANESGNILFEEWKQARELMKAFDDRIHDLRKYGFTFITGLMAAEGILLPWIPPTGSSEATGIPDEAKFGVLVATILLIIVLRWFDGNYQGYLYGVSVRAGVIERFLNLELTTTIAFRYKAEKLWLPQIILYIGFEFSVVLLAIALLPKHYDWIGYLSIGIIAEGCLYYAFASPERLRNLLGGTDWALDRIQCRQYEQIRIMVTNLNPRKWRRSGTISWAANEIAWEIIDKNGNMTAATSHKEVVQTPIQLGPGWSYVWGWTAAVTPGIYRVKIYYYVMINNIRQPQFRELARKIQVLPPLPKD
jgi:hypothetical protein